MFTPNEFLTAAKLANVNLPEVVRALSAGHLVHKVAGYADTLMRAAHATGSSATSLGEAIADQENTQANGTVVCGQPHLIHLLDLTLICCS